MTVKFVSGDLFLLPKCESFAQGCNARGVMGKGIALSFKRRWPAMYVAYREGCLSGALKPGEVFVWRASDALIFNAITQSSPGPHAKYEHVKQCLRCVAQVCSTDQLPRLAMPRIGAGIGGLEWVEIKKIIVETFEGLTTEVFVVEDYISGVIPSEI